MQKSDELGIGVMIRFGVSPEENFKRLKSFGVRHCQIVGAPDHYLYGTEGRSNTRRLMNRMEEYDIASCSVFCSFPDQNWSRARKDVGHTPPGPRAERIARACRTADWAKELGIDQIAIHAGFIPEDTLSEEYRSFIHAMKGVARFLEANGQVLAYETGQEPLDILIRTMNDVGTDNQRISFDPANLLFYNNNDPMEFVDVLSDRIVHIHCKDAVRPRSGEEHGHKTRLGEGGTKFREIFRKLYRKGYRGPLTIERETAGERNSTATSKTRFHCLKNSNPSAERPENKT